MISKFIKYLSSSTKSSISSSSSLSSIYSLSPRLKGYDADTVWHEFTGLAIKLKAVNLGQGFPDFKPPKYIVNSLYNAITDLNLNMYARSQGYIPLCNIVAKLYTERLGVIVNPLENVLITVGSTEALFCIMQGILKDKDEIVTFEPAFDIYAAQAKMAGATLSTVPLYVEKGKWVFDRMRFVNAFNNKTRMIILNTPHNPTGKVFTKDELEFIADVVKKHPDVIVVTDEVYDNLVYSPNTHTRFASLPDMWNRTITVSSAGKTFSVTGWKIGHAVGPAHLIKPAAIAHQWTTFSISTPMQEAVSQALVTATLPYEDQPTYYKWLNNEYIRKKKLLSDSLISAGITPIAPEGTFFIMGDTSKISIPEKYAAPNVARDYAFCRYLLYEHGVASIPPSAFMCDKNKDLVKNYARFAFCKSDDVILEASKRLKNLKL